MYDPRFQHFYLLTGVSFVAFASSFSVCLFNIDTVDQCVANANEWVAVFKQFGDHIIAWGIAFVRAAFHA